MFTNIWKTKLEWKSINIIKTLWRVLMVQKTAVGMQLLSIEKNPYSLEP